MKTLKRTSKTKPETVVFNKRSVDVNTGIEEFKTKQIWHKEPIKMFRYTSTRYTITEYLEKLTKDETTTAQAVAELTDVYLGDVY